MGSSVQSIMLTTPHIYVQHANVLQVFVQPVNMGVDDGRTNDEIELQVSVIKKFRSKRLDRAVEKIELHKNSIERFSHSSPVQVHRRTFIFSEPIC